MFLGGGLAECSSSKQKTTIWGPQTPIEPEWDRTSVGALSREQAGTDRQAQAGAGGHRFPFPTQRRRCAPYALYVVLWEEDW